MTHINPEAKNFAFCGGPFDNCDEVVNWSVQTTTPAELAVIAFLQQKPDRIAGKRLLHVGVGTSVLFEAIGNALRDYTGVSISKEEIEHFNRMFPDRPDAEALIFNKHNPSHYSRLSGLYDIIVDVNLKSFACCETHYRDMVDLFAGLLAPGGAIITAQSGLDFGWADTPGAKRTYTPGLTSMPEVRAHRILGVEGVRDLAGTLGFACESQAMPGIRHRLGQADHQDPPLVMDEILWLLRKGAA